MWKTAPQTSGARTLGSLANRVRGFLPLLPRHRRHQGVQLAADPGGEPPRVGNELLGHQAAVPRLRALALKPELGVHQRLPFLDQRGVGPLEDRAQVPHHIPDGVRLEGVRDVLIERLVGLGQVP